MKKTYSFLLSILVGITYAHGQTGINTKSPQQKLHVAGASTSSPIGSTGISTITPTIRIDGLNNTNNSALYAAVPSLVQPVSATQDGDLVLSSDYAIPLVATTLGTDALTATSIEAPNADQSAEKSLKTGGYTFTLQQPSLVHFLASVSASVYQANSTTLITDGFPKSYHVHFRFLAVPVAVPPIATGTTPGANFGTDGNSYTNGNTGGATGDMYVEPEAYIVLPKGTYTVDLIARVYGINYPFRGTFGAGAADMVSIIAIPL